MTSSSLRFGRVVLCASFVAIAPFLGSCQLMKNQMQFDRSAELDLQDYRNALAPAPLPPETQDDIPDFQPVLATPEDLKLPSPLVTVSVNQTVSLRDLMFELADQADVDIELDPQIRGSIIFTAKERPFDQIIDRICEMSGLRYRFEGNVLRIELDRPYVKNYPVDFLNVERKGETNIKTEISLSTASGDGGGGGGGGGGSKSSIDNKVEGDLWKDLSDNVDQILTSSDTYISLATLADPVAAPVNPLPQPPPYNPNDPNSQPPPLPGSPAVAPIPAAVAPTLSVSAPPAEPLVPNPPATFSISKQTGMMSVFASDRQQKQVKKFVDEFRKRVTTQVVIEAKVLQVDLTDEYATGINWNDLSLTGLLSLNGSFASPGIPNQTGQFTARLKSGNDINAAIEAISRFGTVRALSSPRVTVLNNQMAVVNVAQNNVYFNFDVSTEEDSDTNETTINIDSEQKSVPEGVLLNVIPAANPDTGEILLSVRPTVSKITSFINDPTIPLALTSLGIDPTTAGVPDSPIPQVAVQEIDSFLRLQSGQIVVMGGLMKDSNLVTDEGIPVLGDLPYIGKAFKSHSDRIVKSELVIFIKAQIVPGSNVDEVDRKLYRDFSLDRRAVRM